MKINLNSSFLLAAVLWAAPFATAQLTLHNFTAFQSPATTVFVGDWALNGDPISGDANPIATFSQGAGVYNFIGGSDADTSGAYFFYTSNPGDLTGLGLLQVSARVLAGNTASNFTVSLFDSLGESAFAVFSTAAFAGPGFTTVSTALVTSPGFDRTDLASFLITGGVFGGTGTLNLALDNLAITVIPRAPSAVPEPSVYGTVGALILVGLVGFRRIRRTTE